MDSRWFKLSRNVVLLAILVHICFCVFSDPRTEPTSSHPGSPPKEARFIQGAHGKGMYKLIVPKSKTMESCGRWVVLVPGLSMPVEFCYWHAEEWAESLDRCIMTYDLYGRGWTEGPLSSLAQDDKAFALQLLEFLSNIPFVERALPMNAFETIDLVGTSLGGAIATFFASVYPYRVNTLTLMAPSGVMKSIPFTAEAARAPILGELLLKAGIARRGMREHFNTVFDQPRSAEEQRKLDRIVEKFDLMWDHEGSGYSASLFSTVRHFPFTQMRPAYRKLQDLDFPVSVIWGTKDRVVPFELLPELLELVPRAKPHVMEGEGHELSSPQTLAALAKATQR